MAQLTAGCAVVTGGASGIGAATVDRLVRDRRAVGIVDRDGPVAELVARAHPGMAVAYEADVRDAAAVETAVLAIEAEMGPVEVLVTAAGACLGKGALDMSWEHFRHDVDVVLGGAFAAARAVLPGMVSRSRGSIVNVVSVNGLGGYGNDAYSAAKAGVINLTRSLAVRHGRDGVRVNAVAPGTIRTPAWDAALAADPALLDRLAARYPLRRVGQADEVAAAIAFLASNDAAYITGAVLPVDGGVLAGDESLMRMLEG